MWIGIGVVIFAVLLILSGIRNDSKFEKRYPFSAQLLREYKDGELDES